MNTIGERIAALMIREKKTQKELAQNAGVTEAAISRYLNNERIPKAEILANIATALNTTSEYLLNGTEDKTVYDEVYRFVARSVRNMSEEEKIKLVRLLLSDPY